MINLTILNYIYLDDILTVNKPNVLPFIKHLPQFWGFRYNPFNYVNLAYVFTGKQTIFQSFTSFFYFLKATYFGDNHMEFTFNSWLFRCVRSWNNVSAVNDGNVTEQNLLKRYCFHTLLKTFIKFYYSYKDIAYKQMINTIIYAENRSYMVFPIHVYMTT